MELVYNKPLEIKDIFEDELEEYKDWKKYYKLVKRCKKCNKIFGTDTNVPDKCTMCSSVGLYKRV